MEILAPPVPGGVPATSCSRSGPTPFATRTVPASGCCMRCASETGAWGRPRLLFQPDIDPDGRLRILTAAGFHAHGGTLVAYAGDYSIDRKSTRLLARTSTDGKTWTAVRDLHVPVCPNHGPQPTASGRLIIAGNTAFPYTDDPTGLSGWKMTGVYPPSMEPFQDNPSTFWDVASCMRWPNLCEGAFYQTDDGLLHALFRVTGLLKYAQRIPLGKPQRRQRRDLEPAVRNRVQQYRRQVPLRATARRPFLLGGQSRGQRTHAAGALAVPRRLAFRPALHPGRKTLPKEIRGPCQRAANTAIRIA